jgi:holo-[acyl-carrier protein] synthase
MAIRVGIDTVATASIRDAVAAHGNRYLERVYTPEEIADCDGNPERLAARFAAKEAALKALRAGEGGIPWTAIAVRRDPTGFVELVLTGKAARLANDQGIAELALSITHEAGLASAVVVASAAKGFSTATE